MSKWFNSLNRLANLCYNQWPPRIYALKSSHHEFSQSKPINIFIIHLKAWQLVSKELILLPGKWLIITALTGKIHDDNPLDKADSLLSSLIKGRKVRRLIHRQNPYTAMAGLRLLHLYILPIP